MRPISSRLDRTSLVNKGIIMDKTQQNYLQSCRAISKKPRAAKITKSCILPARVANHSAGFGLYCLLMELVTRDPPCDFDARLPLENK